MNILIFGFRITSIFICISSSILMGCIANEEEVVKENNFSEKYIDLPSILPDWQDGDYHDYQATVDMLKIFNDRYPSLVDIFSIGKSVLGRDIWCIRLTNEREDGGKYSCLIDGCIHGNEWEAGEACLYLADYLLINFDRNKTITNILNKTEVYIVPLFNPDGRENDDRFNANGIDLNRNFDVHFGRLRSRNYPLGKLFGFIKIPMIKIPGTHITFTNAGRYPFSEPETKAIKNLAYYLASKNLSFYVNCHTAQHYVSSIINITYKPEFHATEHEIEILDYVADWINENTEYTGFHVEDISYTGSGVAHHWFFKEFHIPSFIFEILSKDYEPWYGHGRHDHLVHWMETTLPVFMYLLVNIENLHNWNIPDNSPVLPEGIPPEPLN